VVESRGDGGGWFALQDSLDGLAYRLREHASLPGARATVGRSAVTLRAAESSDVGALLGLINGYAERGLLLWRGEASLRARLRDFVVAVQETADGEEVVGCAALAHLGPGLGEVRSLAVRAGGSVAESLAVCSGARAGAASWTSWPSRAVLRSSKRWASSRRGASGSRTSFRPTAGTVLRISAATRSRWFSGGMGRARSGPEAGRKGLAREVKGRGHDLAPSREASSAQYLTEQPYGWVAAVGTGLPAIAASSASWT
jgi:hypothetical protein